MVGPAYRRYDARVDLPKGVQNDTEFLAINPCGLIPALVEDDVTMVESIAIMDDPMGSGLT